jgi:prevent-host-death family protein
MIAEPTPTQQQSLARNERHIVVRLFVPSRRVMAVTESDARARLFPLIEQVNADQEPVEIVWKKGTAFLVSKAQYR